MTDPAPANLENAYMDVATVRPNASIDCNATTRGLTPGKKVNGYTILSEVARGGMGVVFVAQHDKMERRVAIKTMLISAHGSSCDRQRFDVEAQAAAKLDHPGIVAIFEVGEYDCDPYLVMEWIDGDNLATRLNHGPLSVQDTIRIGIEVADAISHAHLRGVVHRDLKPANIILDRQQNERAIITDFGVAKCIETVRGGLTTAGEPIGTPHYMPPEQADSSRGLVGPVSDIYSLGGLMYAMLSGRPPFQAASSIDVILQVLSNDPLPLRKLIPTLPAGLEAIVMKCLQKDPRRRYKTASDLSRDIQNFRDGKPTLARPLNSWRWLGYQIRHHVLFATASGSVGALLLIVSVAMTIAYANTLPELMRLREEKKGLNDVMQIERNNFRKLLSQLQNREVTESEFHLERLATYAESISKKDPDLATRLSIETVRLAEKEDLIPPVFCVEWLRSVVSLANNGFLADAIQIVSPLELASAAETRLNATLTVDSKRTHEITVAGVVPSIDLSRSSPDAMQSTKAK